MTGRASTSEPNPGAFSRQEWVDGALRTVATRVAGTLVEALAPWRPRCVFLGGSAALGEAVGWEESPGAGRRILSDLDLGILTVEAVPAATRRAFGRAAREAAVAAVRSAEQGIEAEDLERHSPVTVGWYEVGAQAWQRPSPGLVEVRDRAVVLWGDAGAPRRFAAPSPERIPPWEGWRLVGNRCLELLRDTGLPDGADDPRAWYARAKLASGLWAARLIGEGRWQIGRSARWEMLERAAGDPVTSDAAAWRLFLEAPGRATLPYGAGGAPDPRPALAAWIREAWEALPSATVAAGSGGRTWPESGFLLESLRIRERLRLWRADAAARRVPADGLSLAGCAWQAMRGDLAGTPEGRRMAVAALYWRLRPGHPDGDPVAWLEGSRWFLGRPIGAGPECGMRLRERLGLGEE